jgi:hypothetical protein
MTAKDIIKFISGKWSFDSNQVHTHTWHDKEDCLPLIENKIEAYAKQKSIEFAEWSEEKYFKCYGVWWRRYANPVETKGITTAELFTIWNEGKGKQ